MQIRSLDFRHFQSDNVSAVRNTEPVGEVAWRDAGGLVELRHWSLSDRLAGADCRSSQNRRVTRKAGVRLPDISFEVCKLRSAAVHSNAIEGRDLRRSRAWKQLGLRR